MLDHCLGSNDGHLYAQSDPEIASHGDQPAGHDSKDGRCTDKGQIPNATFTGLDIWK